MVRHLTVRLLRLAAQRAGVHPDAAGALQDLERRHEHRPDTAGAIRDRRAARGAARSTVQGQRRESWRSGHTGQRCRNTDTIHAVRRLASDTAGSCSRTAANCVRRHDAATGERDRSRRRELPWGHVSFESTASNTSWSRRDAVQPYYQPNYSRLLAFKLAARRRCRRRFRTRREARSAAEHREYGQLARGREVCGVNCAVSATRSARFRICACRP